MEEHDWNLAKGELRVVPRADGDGDAGMAALKSATDQYVRLKQELTEERALNADLVMQIEFAHNSAASEQQRIEILLASIRQLHHALYRGTTYAHILRASMGVTEAERVAAAGLGLTEEETRVTCYAAPLGEWYDGNGYPEGLAGSEIPVASRIVAAIDAYCAMIDERSYKQAMSPEYARAELARCAGTQFDPRVVDAVLIAIDDVDGSTDDAAGGITQCGLLPRPALDIAPAVRH